MADWAALIIPLASIMVALVGYAVAKRSHMQLQTHMQTLQIRRDAENIVSQAQQAHVDLRSFESELEKFVRGIVAGQEAASRAAKERAEV